MIRDKASIFRKEIKNMIKETGLDTYTIPNLNYRYRGKGSWVSNLIILPHKIVVLDVRLKNSEIVKVYKDIDVTRSHEKEKYRVHRKETNNLDEINGDVEIVWDSMVQHTLENCFNVRTTIAECMETTATEEVIDLQYDFLGEKKETRGIKTGELRVEPLICIEAPKVDNYQTQVPIVTKQGLYHYLKALEDELSFYKKEMVDELFEKRRTILENVFKIV